MPYSLYHPFVQPRLNTYSGSIPGVTRLRHLHLYQNCNFLIPFLKQRKWFRSKKWIPDVFINFRPSCCCPFEGHQYGVLIPSSTNLCGTFWQMTQVWDNVQTWDLELLFIYLSSITLQLLDFIHWINWILFLLLRDSVNRHVEDSV